MTMKPPGRVCGIIVLAITQLCPSVTAESTGSICIAPFDSRTYNGPAMDLPGPGVDSTYTFRVDRKRTPGLEARVALLERGFIERVPTDRPVLVEVLLDGKPVEAFRLDLGKEPEGRYCTQLYTGYWHWVRAFDANSPGCACWPRPTR